jgi:DNA-binding beta-propeller fold protein YncE
MNSVHRTDRRRGILVRALASLLLAVPPIASSSPARAVTSVGGQQLWANHFVLGDTPHGVALSPDGSTLYVTGCGGGVAGCAASDFETAAFRVSTGAVRWTATFDGPGHATDTAIAVAVTPDGSQVFVTGESVSGSPGYDDIVTIAYDARTGRRLWIADYDGPGHENDIPSDMAVTPDGTKVLVTGSTLLVGSGAYVTIAYDTATGAQDWLATYSGPYGAGVPRSIALSSDGSRAYVTGEGGGAYYDDFATVAYDVGSGTELWASRYNDDQKPGDIAYSVAVSPDGTKVFITGCLGTIDICVSADYATIAYDAVTGSQLWIQTYNGPVDGSDVPVAIAPSPDGTKVFVTGSSDQLSTTDYVTIAYDSTTGVQDWLATFDGPDDRTELACCLAINETGSKVVVSGRGAQSSFFNAEFETVAYRASSGTQLWSALYTGSPDFAYVYGVAITRNGTLAFVAGAVEGSGVGHDWQVIAYRA